MTDNSFFELWPNYHRRAEKMGIRCFDLSVVEACVDGKFIRFGGDWIAPVCFDLEKLRELQIFASDSWVQASGNKHLQCVLGEDAILVTAPSGRISTIFNERRAVNEKRFWELALEINDFVRTENIIVPWFIGRKKKAIKLVVPVLVAILSVLLFIWLLPVKPLHIVLLCCSLSVVLVQFFLRWASTGNGREVSDISRMPEDELRGLM